MPLRILTCHLTIFYFTLLWVPGASAQCPEGPGIIYSTNESVIALDTLAKLAAPMFWFSPDEPGLMDAEGRIQIPEAFPYAEDPGQPVVYYKIVKIYTSQKRIRLKSGNSFAQRSKAVDLSTIAAFEIEYYCYYAMETGLGGHPHDLESTQLQIQVIQSEDCAFRYALQVKRVIARAHGLYWFENALNVDNNTIFPISILVEEGKHANCTDKNADGIYTPGFDVTEKVNDAWGVRDIISTGKLFSGGFQAWMAKERTPKTLLLPPDAYDRPAVIKIKERFPGIEINQEYVLKAFPPWPESHEDKQLKKMVLSKKPVKWPKLVAAVQANQSIVRLSKQNKLRNKIGFSYRFDEDNSFALSVPLLFVRHVEAPMTGGWFYHKFYFGDEDSTPEQVNHFFGHQIQHTNSASRWLDNYIGVGYEVIDIDEELNSTQPRTYLVTEIGMKIRVNITKTPLKFLKFLGTDYWGIRLGWKNLGFNPFIYSGIVLEVGAGAF